MFSYRGGVFPERKYLNSELLVGASPVTTDTKCGRVNARTTYGNTRALEKKLHDQLDLLFHFQRSAGGRRGQSHSQ